jgi:hypothetical protein
MRYRDGTAASLGDIVRVPVPTGTARARIVMLGDTYEHLDIDPEFVSRVKSDHMLEPDSVVVEWLGDNPFAHNDPRFAPVGNYLFSPLDEHVSREA